MFKISSHFLKFLIGFSCLWITLELIFRFANPLDFFLYRTPWLQEQFHHSPKPGHFTLNHGNENITYHINSYGMRAPEISVTKQPGTLRILILGDSFVFGEGVQEKDTWICQLAKMLSQTKNRPSIELLNGGMWGYSPLLEYLWFKQRLINLKPDLVVQGVFSNDLSDDYAFSLIAEYAATGEILRVPHHFKPNTAPLQPLLDRSNWLFQHSVAIKYLVWLGEELRQTKPISIPGDILTDPYAHCRENAPDWQAHYQHTIQYLTQTATLCQANGIRYIATLLPNPSQLNSSRLYQILNNAAQQHHFDFWNLYESFRDQLPPSCFHPHHGHLTVAGNRRMAEILWPWFIGISDF